MEFVSFAILSLEKLVLGVASRSIGDVLKDARKNRRMQRLVGDAVDRLSAQLDDYLTLEKLPGYQREVLLGTICGELERLVAEPAQLFAADLDGQRIFKQVHPDGNVPQVIREQHLDQHYSVLFPQVAHFISGSAIALEQWVADGQRETFRRFRELADEISVVSEKVSAIGAKFDGTISAGPQRSEKLLRDFAQTLLNQASLRLDLSPLRADRPLHGTLSDHFVTPIFLERVKGAKPLTDPSDVLESLAGEGTRTVVHGTAGAGKSTWSLWVQQQFLQLSSPRIPCIVRLRAYDTLEQLSLLDLLREQGGPHLKERLDAQTLDHWQEQGRLVVIFDGFDEIGAARRDAVEGWLRDLDNIAGRAALIVTSRPLQTGHLADLPDHWHHWTLQPFDKGRIVEFIQRWHTHLPATELGTEARNIDAQRLAETFLKDESLQPLARTPLTLGTLLFVHHRDGKLPSGRVNLYERYIAAMLGLRDSGLGINARATRLNDTEKRRVLGHIALHFHLNQTNEVDDTVMEILVTDALRKFRYKEDVETLIAALRERSGLLIGPGAWSFVHKTVSEFLVAELVHEGTTFLEDDSRLDREYLWEQRHNDAWLAVLFFWAGKTTARELEQFIGKLIEDEAPVSTLLAIALIHDQGERIDFDWKREAIEKCVRLPFATKGGSSAVSGLPVVPERFYCEIEADSPTLPGLAEVSLVQALSQMFTLGILKPNDLLNCHAQFRDPITVAFLWSGEGRKMGDLRHDATFKHLAPTNIPLLLFPHSGASIEQWIAAYPDCGDLVPLLLAGRMSEIWNWMQEDMGGSDEQLAEVADDLWNWREAPVRQDWLIETGSCKGWTVDDEDLLAHLTNAMLVIEKTGTLSASKISDLRIWIERMKTMREEQA
ncbi:MAG TPA: NACHT domain-containing protein [Chthoniobacterales bacterium]|nr:NACHT domain-containing protein [Chthoniobacterales bacterium]